MRDAGARGDWGLKEGECGWDSGRNQERRIGVRGDGGKVGGGVGGAAVFNVWRKGSPPESPWSKALTMAVSVPLSLLLALSMPLSFCSTACSRCLTFSHSLFNIFILHIYSFHSTASPVLSALWLPSSTHTLYTRFFDCSVSSHCGLTLFHSTLLSAASTLLPALYFLQVHKFCSRILILLNIHFISALFFQLHQHSSLLFALVTHPLYCFALHMHFTSLRYSFGYIILVMPTNSLSFLSGLMLLITTYLVILYIVSCMTRKSFLSIQIWISKTHAHIINHNVLFPLFISPFVYNGHLSPETLLSFS